MSDITEKSFDLEQQILACWNITSELDVLVGGILEHGLTQDQVVNVLLGLKQLYELKFDKMFHTFEDIHRDVCIRAHFDV